MKFLQLLKPDYLFDPTPGTEFAYFLPLMIAGGVIFLGTLLFRAKHASHNWPARVREWAFFFMLVVFFRDQNIPYLGSRIAMVLMVLIGLVYGIWAWRHERYRLRLAEEVNVIRAAKKARAVDPYLPKKKRK
jgi:hypothetical protein